MGRKMGKKNGVFFCGHEGGEGLCLCHCVATDWWEKDRRFAS